MLCSFLPQKRTKKLVALKTHFDSGSVVLFTDLLSRLFVFHFLFLSNAFPLIVSCPCMKQDFRAVQTIYRDII